jgi:hypothetical protein
MANPPRRTRRTAIRPLTVIHYRIEYVVSGMWCGVVAVEKKRATFEIPPTIRSKNPKWQALRHGCPYSC